MEGKLRILLLEDSPADAFLMEHELREAKLTFTAKRVETEEAFVAWLDHFKPHLVIGDYRLPHYDGLKALTYIQENYPEIPFIFVSGAVGEDMAVESLKLGAKDYVLKDRLSRLAPAVQRALLEVENYREQRQVFQEFLNLAKFPSENPNPVLRIAQDGQILYANKSSAPLLQFWGCEIGQQLADAPKQLVLECLASGLQKEVEEICANFVYSLVFTPIREMNYLNIYGTDITQRKQMEKTLQENDELLKVLINSNPEALFLIDTQGTIIAANEALAKRFGKRVSELIGTCTYDLLPRELAKRRKGCVEAVVNSCWPLRFEDSRTGLILDNYLHPIFDADGKVTRIAVLSVDITVRKQAEARLARLNDCFLNFGNNFDANIQRLVEVGGDLLGGTCALYNRLEGDKLLSVGQWQTPGDYQAVDVAQGHLCFDVIYNSADKPLVVRNLQASPYAQTDPNVRRYNLQTYIGVAVHCQQVAVGSMCVVYQADIEPAPNDLLLLNILATAIGVEEERKHAGEELQRLRRHQELILNSTWEGIIALDLAGNQTFVNPVAARMLGYEVEELLGRHSHLVWHHSKTDGTPVSEDECPIYAALRKGEAYHGREEIFCRKDGTSFPAECYFAPLIENGAIEGGVVTFKDVSERSEAEELSRNLMSWSPVGIYILRDKRLKLANRWFQTITGYSADELFLMDPLPKLVHPEDQSEVRRNASGMLSGECSAPYEYRIITKEGDIRWIMETVTPIKYLGKEAVLGYFMDITERKQLESQLLQAQKMEAIGRLAGGVAHDFNNMLGAILGYADMILMTLHRDDPLQHHTEAIKRAADRAASLTRQLLAFSRKQIMKPEIININAMVLDIEKMLRRVIGEDIDLILNLDPLLGVVQADPGQITQIIMNLAVNARDAMPRGGKLAIMTTNIILTDADINRHIETHPGPYVMLTISDTGTGMDKKTLSRIFEPFFTTKEIGKGTGLGLSTVYGITQQSGGFIEVSSEPGQGTKFEVYLPQVEEAVEPPPKVEANTILRGTETILLAEDEELLRDLINSALKMYGYIVLSCGHGGEALLLSESYKGSIDLLLTDVVMPEMSGPELAERLAPRHPEMKVIYISGYTDAQTLEDIVDAATPFIQKPFSPVYLLRQIRQVFDRKR